MDLTSHHLNKSSKWSGAREERDLHISSRPPLLLNCKTMAAASSFFLYQHRCMCACVKSVVPISYTHEVFLFFPDLFFFIVSGFLLPVRRERKKHRTTRSKCSFGNTCPAAGLPSSDRTWKQKPNNRR